MDISKKVSREKSIGWEPLIKSFKGKEIYSYNPQNKLSLHELKYFLENDFGNYHNAWPVCFIENNRLEIYSPSETKGPLLGKGQANLNAIRAATSGNISRKILDKTTLTKISSGSKAQNQERIFLTEAALFSTPGREQEEVIRLEGTNYVLSPEAKKDIRAKIETFIEINKDRMAVSPKFETIYVRPKDAYKALQKVSELENEIKRVVRELHPAGPGMEEINAITKALGIKNVGLEGQTLLNKLKFGRITIQDYLDASAEKSDLPIQFINEVDSTGKTNDDYATFLDITATTGSKSFPLTVKLKKNGLSAENLTTLFEDYSSFFTREKESSIENVWLRNLIVSIDGNKVILHLTPPLAKESLLIADLQKHLAPFLSKDVHFTIEQSQIIKPEIELKTILSELTVKEHWDESSYSEDENKIVKSARYKLLQTLNELEINPASTKSQNNAIIVASSHMQEIEHAKSEFRIAIENISAAKATKKEEFQSLIQHVENSYERPESERSNTYPYNFPLDFKLVSTEENNKTYTDARYGVLKSKSFPEKIETVSHIANVIRQTIATQESPAGIRSIEFSGQGNKVGFFLGCSDAVDNSKTHDINTILPQILECVPPKHNARTIVHNNDVYTWLEVDLSSLNDLDITRNDEEHLAALNKALSQLKSSLTSPLKQEELTKFKSLIGDSAKYLKTFPDKKPSEISKSEVNAYEAYFKRPEKRKWDNSILEAIESSDIDAVKSFIDEHGADYRLTRMNNPNNSREGSVTMIPLSQIALEESKPSILTLLKNQYQLPLDTPAMYVQHNRKTGDAGLTGKAGTAAAYHGEYDVASHENNSLVHKNFTPNYIDYELFTFSERLKAHNHKGIQITDELRAECSREVTKEQLLTFATFLKHYPENEWRNTSIDKVHDMATKRGLTEVVTILTGERPKPLKKPEEDLITLPTAQKEENTTLPPENPDDIKPAMQTVYSSTSAEQDPSAKEEPLTFEEGLAALQNQYSDGKEVKAPETTPPKKAPNAKSTEQESYDAQYLQILQEIDKNDGGKHEQQKFPEEMLTYYQQAHEIAKGSKKQRLEAKIGKMTTHNADVDAAILQQDRAKLTQQFVDANVSGLSEEEIHAYWEQAQTLKVKVPTSFMDQLEAVIDAIIENDEQAAERLTEVFCEMEAHNEQPELFKIENIQDAALKRQRTGKEA